jgi:hypothetical protein
MAEAATPPVTDIQYQWGGCGAGFGDFGQFTPAPQSAPPLGKIMENKDINITLQYNLDEINNLLSLLGALPFSQSASVINNIQMQAMPQLPRVAQENQDQAEQQ